MMSDQSLLLEPFGGMAGDMLLAALLDLGDKRFTLEHLQQLAERLVPGEARLTSERVWRGSLGGTLLSVHTPESESTPHRHFADLKQLIQQAHFSSYVEDLSCRVLWRLAQAEARVHDTTPEQIHFHEVGAVDTLIDVCGAAFAMEALSVTQVWSTPPLIGSGTVTCAHGEMPVPAPAVAELLRGRALRTGGGCERLTPTAAAWLVTLCENFEVPRAFTTSAIGYGAGHREPSEGPPNLVRVQLGSAVALQAGSTPSATENDQSLPRSNVQAFLMEVTLDDMSGQEIAHVLRAVRAAGALEAWTSPVFMKKDRPGTQLSALCRSSQRRALEDVVFGTSASFGLRWSEVRRTECGRSQCSVNVMGVDVRVKRRIRPASELSQQTEVETSVLARDLFPEDDDLARLVAESTLSYSEARDACVHAALAILALA
ncbi:MAG: hypothetical protein ACI841_001455 [Planctomycetota bacterium]|jgi:uncharacterized protein (TIGR00299 family) protein